MGSVYTGKETVGVRVGGQPSAPQWTEVFDVKWDDKYDPDAPLLLEDLVGTFVCSSMARLSDASKGYVAIADDRITYVSQSVNFTVGAKITGATSGATATIVYDEDAGATGRLTIKDKSPGKDFVTGEVITDDETVPGTATTSVVKPCVRVYQVNGAVIDECAKDVDLTGVSVRIAITTY